MGTIEVTNKLSKNTQDIREWGLNPPKAGVSKLFL